MAEVIRPTLRHPLYALTGAVVAAVAILGTPASFEIAAVQVHRFYNWLRPAVTMQGEIVERGADSVTVHIWGSKNCSDTECVFRGVQAFTSGPACPVPCDAIVERVDLPQKGDTKPAGQYDIGHWRVWPVYAGSRHSRVSIYVNHLRNGRPASTLIAEVDL